MLVVLGIDHHFQVQGVGQQPVRARGQEVQLSVAGICPAVEHRHGARVQLQVGGVGQPHAAHGVFGLHRGVEDADRFGRDRVLHDRQHGRVATGERNGLREAVSKELTDRTRRGRGGDRRGVVAEMAFPPPTSAVAPGRGVVHARRRRQHPLASLLLPSRH